MIFLSMASKAFLLSVASMLDGTKRCAASSSTVTCSAT